MIAIGRFSGFPARGVFGGRGARRLIRGYFLVSLVLVLGGLITSGLLEIYFLYFESREQISQLQNEIAGGAVFKIEQFIQEIEKTMRGATKSREVVLKGISPEYKFELRRLLLIAPPITEAVAIDLAGVARTHVSRLRTILPGDRRDIFSTAAFRQAIQGKSYFGPVHFVQGSEPYMTIAVPIERFAGEVIGVLQAEVNLKYIWDKIFSSHELIPGLDWAVIIEQPVDEAYEKLYASLFRTSGLLPLGLGMAFLASLFMVRRVIHPLETFRKGAELIGSGNLEHRLEIKTGGELEVLAEEFNKMTAALQEDHTELAARMAIEVQSRINEFRPEWRGKGYELDVGIGIAAGFATLGTIGFEGRMDYGAIGNVTIMASRLSSEAQGGQILTNRKTLTKIENLVEAEPLGKMQLKGFARPVSTVNISKLK